MDLDAFWEEASHLDYFISIKEYGQQEFEYLLENNEKFDDPLDLLTFCVVGGDVKFLFGRYAEDELFQLSSKGDYYIINPKFLPDRSKGDPITRRVQFGGEGRILLEDAMVAGFNSNKCWLSFCNLLTNSLFLQIVNVDNKTYLQPLNEAIVDVDSTQVKKYMREGSSEKLSCACLISFMRNFSSCADAGALQQGFWNPLDKRFFSMFKEYFNQNGSRISLTSKEVSDNLLGLTINSLRDVFRHKTVSTNHDVESSLISGINLFC